MIIINDNYFKNLNHNGPSDREFAGQLMKCFETKNSILFPGQSHLKLFLRL